MRTDRFLLSSHLTHSRQSVKTDRPAESRMDRDERDGSDAARARDGSVCTIACLVRARACGVIASLVQ